MGKKIDNSSLDIIVLIFSAINSAEQKRYKILQEASLKIDLLKILIRIAKEVKALDNKKYIQLQKELQEIGKMLGGWLRSLTQKAP